MSVIDERGNLPDWMDWIQGTPGDNKAVQLYWEDQVWVEIYISSRDGKWTCFSYVDEYNILDWFSFDTREEAIAFVQGYMLGNSEEER